MPFFSVFSGVAHGPHQSTPNASHSFSVVAPLMNAHNSPMGLGQNDLMLRSVMTGNPLGKGNRLRLLHGGERVDARPAPGLDPRAENPLNAPPVLRGSGALVIR